MLAGENSEPFTIFVVLKTDGTCISYAALTCLTECKAGKNFHQLGIHTRTVGICSSLIQPAVASEEER